jgi:hypothetical protein
MVDNGDWSSSIGPTAAEVQHAADVLTRCRVPLDDDGLASFQGGSGRGHLAVRCGTAGCTAPGTSRGTALPGLKAPWLAA